MKWITHQTGAVFLGLALGLSPAGVASASVGALVPDIVDQKVSNLGSTRAQRQRIFNKIHRGTSHWFGWWLAMLAGAFCFPLQFIPSDALAGVAFGGLSHVALDMLTPYGVPVLPFSRKTRVSLNMCKTGSAAEYIFLGCIALLSAYMYGPEIADFSKSILTCIN